MGYLFAIVVALLAIGGGGLAFYMYGAGKDVGREECRAAVEAKQTELDKKAGQLETEAANHISDMVTAYDVGESQAKTRIIYRQTKGAQDVASNPNLSSQACALPPVSVDNLNAARAGIRRDPGDVGSVLNDASRGAGAGAGTSANTGSTDGTMRGTDAASGRDTGAAIPKDARGRRPMGKVHPQP